VPEPVTPAPAALSASINSGLAFMTLTPSTLVSRMPAPNDPTPGSTKNDASRTSSALNEAATLIPNRRKAA